MTNLGNEKSPNKVYRNIVPIVPAPPVESTQTIEHQSLRGRNNKNFIVPGPYFPAFYRSICSRSIIFVIQTKDIFAQEKRIIDAINKEGQTLINTTSFKGWDNNIEDRLEQIIKRRRRVFNISRALRSNGLHRRDIRQILQTTDRHTTRLGELRTKSLGTRQSHSSILTKK